MPMDVEQESNAFLQDYHEKRELKRKQNEVMSTPLPYLIQRVLVEPLAGLYNIVAPAHQLHTLEVAQRSPILQSIPCQSHNPH